MSFLAAALLQMYEHGTDKVLERRDLLHPNADGHKSMADMIIIYLAQQVTRPSLDLSLFIGKDEKGGEGRGETRRVD